jgi:NAD(P)H-hydrate epimerase
MIKVVSNEEMRRLDHFTINDLQAPGIILMENAGYQSFLKIKQECEKRAIHEALIFTGKGNNGGDGFVAARHFAKAGFDVRIFSLAVGDELKGDAKVNYTICVNYKIPVKKIEKIEDLPQSADGALIVDALFGNGIRGAIRGFAAEVIRWINAQDAFVAAIDIPSGINGNSASVEGTAVKADLTSTMALPKYAHLFYPAKDYVGELFIADISMPRFVEQSPDVAVNWVEEKDAAITPPRSGSHKYSNGKVFLLCGSPGMTGAAALAAEGAGVSGAGLVTVGIARSLNPVLEIKLTEQMTLPLADDGNGTLIAESLNEIRAKIDWADAVLIGSGMGRDEGNLTIMKEAVLYAVSSGKNMVIDADALFMLGENRDLLDKLPENVVLTPHYGEFLRLSGGKKEALQEMPWESAANFSRKYGCVLNLKGAPSLAAAGGEVYVNSSGNAALAKGGSGDILGGLIAGLLARGTASLRAAYSANYFHGKAADIALQEYGSFSFQPKDILPYLKRLI